MKSSYLLLVLRLIAVAFVMLCGYFDNPYLALMVVVVMIIYILFAIKTSNDECQALEFHADQIYFIGYLSTISAFAAAILKIWLSKDEMSDFKPILLMSGVALSTTVLGLIAMTSLKDYAQSLNNQNKMEIDLDNKIFIKETSDEKLQVLINQVKDLGGFAQIYKIADESAKKIEDLNEEVLNLKDQISELKKSVGTLDGSVGTLDGSIGTLDESVAQLKINVDKGTDSASKFKQNIDQLQSVLDMFVSLLKRKIDIPQSFDKGQ
jgi:methyl-accepting chemotaxis protein